MTFYLQKHDIRKWNHYKNLIKDITPAHHQTSKLITNKKNKSKSSKNKNAFARFLSLEYHFMWFSIGDTLGPIHYDAYENIYSVIRGTKTFEIFHPLQSGELYEVNASFYSAHMLYKWSKNKQSNIKNKINSNIDSSQIYYIPIHLSEKQSQPFSPVNISFPDYKLYPKFKNARKLICQVNEGDILYLPSYWWHEVTGKPSPIDNISIAINSFYKPYWLKANNYINYGRNVIYHHLHKNEINRKNIKKNILKKRIDINYWR
jgi:jumonji domain-containing protein 7